MLPVMIVHSKLKYILKYYYKVINHIKLCD